MWLEFRIEPPLRKEDIGPALEKDLISSRKSQVMPL